MGICVVDFPQDVEQGLGINRKGTNYCTEMSVDAEIL